MSEQSATFEQISYTPEQAAALVGRSRTWIFKAIKDAEITARKDGKATLLERDELLRWVRSLPTIGRSVSEASKVQAVLDAFPAKPKMGSVVIKNGTSYILGLSLPELQIGRADGGKTTGEKSG